MRVNRFCLERIMSIKLERKRFKFKKYKIWEWDCFDDDFILIFGYILGMRLVIYNRESKNG